MIASKATTEESDDEFLYGSRSKKSAGSPLARRLKQQRIQREESLLMKEEEAERQRKRQQKSKIEKPKEFEKRFDRFDSDIPPDSYNDIKYQANKDDVPPAPAKPIEESSSGNETKKRRSKERADLQINESIALKEMSKLYRDLLERFEELRLKQESQMNAESDSTRLRRLAKTDPSVMGALQEVIEAIKSAVQDFKTCAGLAGSMLPNSVLHERELGHILLELECAAVLDWLKSIPY